MSGMNRVHGCEAWVTAAAITVIIDLERCVNTIGERHAAFAVDTSRRHGETASLMKLLAVSCASWRSGIALP